MLYDLLSRTRGCFACHHACQAQFALDFDVFGVQLVAKWLWPPSIRAIPHIWYETIKTCDNLTNQTVSRAHKKQPHSNWLLSIKAFDGHKYLWHISSIKLPTSCFVIVKDVKLFYSGTYLLHLSNQLLCSYGIKLARFFPPVAAFQSSLFLTISSAFSPPPHRHQSRTMWKKNKITERL